MTVRELRNLVLQETTEGWGTARGTGPVDPVAGFRGKKPGGAPLGDPKTGAAFADTEHMNAQSKDQHQNPKTQQQLVMAVKELIQSVKGVQDPKAVETLFKIIRAATDNIKTLKNKQGSGFGQGLAKAVNQVPPSGPK